MFTTAAFTLVDMLVAVVGCCAIGWVSRMLYDDVTE